MIDVKKAAESLSRLSVLKFFPADEIARATIVEEVCEMCGSNARIDWLARRAVKLWNEWEGLRELRIMFCSSYQPADGIDPPEASSISKFAEGYPSEHEQIAAPPQRQLPGKIEPATKDPEMLNLVHETAARIPNLRLSMADVKIDPLRANENELEALARAARESRPVVVPVSTDPLAKVKAATSVDIELLKREQNKNRRESVEYAEAQND